MNEKNNLDPSKWVDEYADFLYNFAFMRVNSKETVEDLVQETFLSAYKNRKQFEGRSTVKTWLTRILKNKIIDYYREKGRNKDYVNYLSETQESFDNSFFNHDNYGRWKEDINKNYISESTEEFYVSKEFYAILEYCLEKLPPKLKSVFVAKYMIDEDAKKICKDFDISSSNYWMILFRSKALLRSCLEKKGINN